MASTLPATVLAMVTPNSQAQSLEEKMHVTFSGPVELPGEVAVGLLELGVLGVAPDAEDGVVVLGRH